MLNVKKFESAALRSRWKGVPPDLKSVSPFGLTVNGFEDFRGSEIVWKTGTYRPIVRNLRVKSADFTQANFDSVDFQKCNFEECVFDGASLIESQLRACKFERCTFARTDLRQCFFLSGQTQFDNCVFTKARLSRINFGETVFLNMRFDGEDWIHVNFGCAGFWNCLFRGEFHDCMFSGTYDMQGYIDEFGHPEKSGFHSVDLSEAEFSASGFRLGWKFDRVDFPKSGSLIIVNVGVLREVLQRSFIFSTQSNRMIDYFDTLTSSLGPEQFVAISRHSLEFVGGLPDGKHLFEKLAASSVTVSQRQIKVF